MTGTAQKLMENDEFLLWCLDQDDRYELVDGVPVSMMTEVTQIIDGVAVKMMAGASNRHDQIVVNIIAELRAQLRGTGCRAATADIAVKTRNRSFRRPGVTVTCDPPRRDTYDATTAKMVVEVLSPTNRGIAWQRKLEEYRNREGLIYILLVEADAIAASLLSRAPGSNEWLATDADGLDAVLPLAQIGCTLAMSEVYAEMTFDA